MLRLAIAAAAGLCLVFPKLREVQATSLIEHDSMVASPEPGPHGGGGQTTAYSFFARTPNLGLGFRKRALHGDAAIGYHLQEEDEIYYVVSGTGELRLNGARSVIGPGTAILTRPGSWHGLRHLGSDDLVIFTAFRQPRSPQAH